MVATAKKLKVVGGTDINERLNQVELSQELDGFLSRCKTAKNGLQTGGNTGRTELQFLVDCIHASGRSNRWIADEAKLAESTVANIRDEITMWPYLDTMERIHGALNIGIDHVEVKITNRHKPKEKIDIVGFG